MNGSNQAHTNLRCGALDGDAIYVGDAGHVFCGRHAGYTARSTGRDLSGQPVLEVTGAQLTAFGLRCESCGSKGAAR
jgi:hypothetical protein